MRPAVYERVRRELFDDAELIASFEYVDRVTLDVPVPRAAPVFARGLQGQRVAGSPELERLGAVPARHAHLHERGPSDLPPEIPAQRPRLAPPDGNPAERLGFRHVYETYSVDL